MGYGSKHNRPHNGRPGGNLISMEEEGAEVERKRAQRLGETGINTEVEVSAGVDAPQSSQGDQIMPLPSSAEGEVRPMVGAGHQR